MSKCATLPLSMPDYQVLRLKPDREISLKNKHHSIFRTAFADNMDVPNGAIAQVQDADGTFMCYAMINPRAYICGRVISFEEGDPLMNLKKNIKRSIDLRTQFFAANDTNAYRLINAEGDGIPGLIVDKYDEIIVVQLTTLGMEKLRPWLTNVLAELCQTDLIYEKSTGATRKKEGLESKEQWLRGSGHETVTVTERGLKFLIQLVGSQKTGLFLDQREMRSLVRSLSSGKNVLDCCSYVGGFSMAALSGGAVHADAIDYDPEAIKRVGEHMALNGFSESQFSAYDEDVFDFLRRKPMPQPYDFIILDPPAFAKRSSDIDQAKRAYTDLNRMAMEMLPAGGMLLTCSCSYQVDPPLFQTIVFHAARQARRSVRILQRHRQAFDHPVNLYHPEVDYLKSLLLWVD